MSFSYAFYYEEKKRSFDTDIVLRLRWMMMSEMFEREDATDIEIFHLK